MSSTVRESSHVSRKIVSHGGHQNTANNLENNLDALLEDLQTSVSRSATPIRGGRALSPQVDYKAPANTTRVVSEGRTMSPTRSTTTTTEKYVTTGPNGSVSGIPGLEALDAELQNVQPGQSKTVAYKQVSYQYKTNLDGSPRDGEAWTMSDNILNTSSPPLIEEIRDRSYEESYVPSKRQRSPDGPGKTSTINRELLYDTSSTSRSRQTSPLPGSQQRDISYVQESSSYQVDPRSPQSTLSSIHTNKSQNTSHDLGSVEYVPIPSPNSAVPINLAPGPNTKVTTTVKTFTYELPGSPEQYLPGTTLPRGVVLPGDQTITYTLPRGGSLDKNVTYHTQKVTSSTLPPGQSISYQVVSPDTPGFRYASPPPPEITTKTTATHQEAKFYREEQHGFTSGPGSPVQKPVNNTNTIVYHSGPSPVNQESVTKVTRNEKYYQVGGNYPNGDGPRSPKNGPGGPNYGPGTDRPDHSTNTTTIIYQNQPPPPKIETRTTTINKSQEYYQGRPYPDPNNYPDNHKPDTPSHTTVNYYTTAPPQTIPPQTNTTIYKYSNTTSTVPPNNKFPDDHEVLLPKPFPTTGVQLYPANGKKPQTPSNGHGPPEKLEDLMASFSDSERVVLADISNQEREQQKIQRPLDASSPKAEVEILPHTPPKVHSKNYAGPPVYYPPGSAEFTKKEEASGAMAQSSGGWQKGKAKYEYEASSKSKSKSSSGAAVVPVCLPLCCAMPCVIM